jgi:DNA-directed RNA polymerase specialized sigma subunit
MRSEKDALYINNKQTIDIYVNSIAEKTGIDKDDILSEANLLFCECLERYKPEKASFKTYFTNSLRLGLYRWSRKRLKEIYQLTDQLDRYPSRSEIIDTTLESLSRDSKQIADLIFDPPVELFNPDFKKYKSESKKITKESLYNFLRTAGWKIIRIEKAFSELSAAVNL